MPTGTSHGQRWRDRTAVAGPRRFLARTLHVLRRTITRGRHHQPRTFSHRAALAGALLVVLGLVGTAGTHILNRAVTTDSTANRTTTRDERVDRGSDERASRRERPEKRGNAKSAAKAKPAPAKAKPKPKPAWVAPTSNFRVTSGFGARWGTTHYGLDFAAPMGTKIVAAHSGVVSLARWHGGYGNAVVVSHGHGVRTLYGHSSRLLVRYGQRVQAGQPIALVGSTGDSTGPHLHFEVHHNNQAVDPRPWMAERGLRF